MVNNSENVKVILENYVRSRNQDARLPETWYALSWSDFSSLKVLFSSPLFISSFLFLLFSYYLLIVI